MLLETGIADAAALAQQPLQCKRERQTGTYKHGVLHRVVCKPCACG